MLAAFSLGGFEIILILIALPIALLGTAFWIWMLIDCIRNESENNDKVAWVLVIALLHLVGAVIYYFVRKLPRKR